MIGDFEYLYMIRKNDEDALEIMMDKFDRLVWSRAHFYFNMYRPQGISVQDLYQEGRIALYESFFSYQEERNVGLAYYIDLCVSSRIKTELRRCRGYSYRMLDTSYSLDMSISEDGSLCLGDLVSDDNIKSDPARMSHYFEAKEILNKIYSGLSDLEKEICQLRQDGFSYNEIALLLKIEAKKVDNVVQKVRRLVSDYKVNKID